MIYLTSDTHGLFVRIESFCEKMNTTRDDLLIILGDAGINFSDGWRDENKKRILIGGRILKDGFIPQQIKTSIRRNTGCSFAYVPP